MKLFSRVRSAFSTTIEEASFPCHWSTRGSLTIDGPVVAGKGLFISSCQKTSAVKSSNFRCSSGPSLLLLLLQL